MRGDVPPETTFFPLKDTFSPRARGCSQTCAQRILDYGVFPACAGMFPSGPHPPHSRHSFPRVRGDVPSFLDGYEEVLPFSPRARGCSSQRRSRPAQLQVFPACAGMFLGGAALGSDASRFPRVRGDVPSRPPLYWRPPRFSPRARGCSCASFHTLGWVVVFPACAGMFLPSSLICTGSLCFPRVRGDVPYQGCSPAPPYAFSPRARGCSHQQHH